MFDSHYHSRQTNCCLVYITRLDIFPFFHLSRCKRCLCLSQFFKQQQFTPWRRERLLRQISVFKIQAQCSANRDGRAPDGLCSQRSLPFVHPRGRVRVAERACRVSSSAGPGRRAVQFILSLEGYRRVYQHLLLVPCLRDAARRAAAEILQGRERVVARRRDMHDHLVAWTRLGSCGKLEKYLKFLKLIQVTCRRGAIL